MEQRDLNRPKVRFQDDEKVVLIKVNKVLKIPTVQSKVMTTFPVALY